MLQEERQICPHGKTCLALGQDHPTSRRRPFSTLTKTPTSLLPELSSLTGSSHGKATGQTISWTRANRTPEGPLSPDLRCPREGSAGAGCDTVGPEHSPLTKGIPHRNYTCVTPPCRTAQKKQMHANRKHTGACQRLGAEGSAVGPLRGRKTARRCAVSFRLTEMFWN